MDEIRLEHGESLWGTRADRDRLIRALEHWQAGEDPGDDWE
jgi:hypothetical protein